MNRLSFIYSKLQFGNNFVVSPWGKALKEPTISGGFTPGLH